MKKRKWLSWTLVAAACLLPTAGCDLGGGANPGVIPENQDPAKARALIENPASLVPKTKTKVTGKGAQPLPPQPPK